MMDKHITKGIIFGTLFIVLPVAITALNRLIIALDKRREDYEELKRREHDYELRKM